MNAPGGDSAPVNASERPAYKIALTGATGFIGQRVCRTLKSGNYELRALARDPARASELLGPQVEIVPGDLADRSGLQELVDGASIVIHMAGQVRGRCTGDFDAINVDGTRRLLQAISASSIQPQLINLSSVAAREPSLSFYAASKRRAETLIEHEYSSITVLNLRPPAVYGPGDTELLPLWKLMAKGLAPLPTSDDARLSLIHVDDLAEAILASIRSGLSGTFEVDDGTAAGYAWRDVASIVATLTGRRVRLVKVPALVLDSVAWSNAKLSKFFRYLPMLTPEKLRELRHPNWVCDGSAFRSETSWSPRWQLAEGLRHTPAWR